MPSIATDLGECHVVRLNRPLCQIVKVDKVLEHAMCLVEGAISIIFGDTILLQKVILKGFRKDLHKPSEHELSAFWQLPR